MTARIDAFLTEIRTAPEFVAEVAIDPKRLPEMMEGLERALVAVGRLADEDPAMVDSLDKIQTAISRRDLSTKAKLLELGKLLVEVRDKMKRIH